MFYQAKSFSGLKLKCQGKNTSLARFGFYGNVALVQIHHLPAQTQADAIAFAFGSKKRHKDLIHNVGLDPSTVVSHINGDASVQSLGSDH